MARRRVPTPGNRKRVLLLQHRCYGQHRKQCCMETWAFALWHPYGHPQETTQSIHSKQKKKIKSKIKIKSFSLASAATLFFVVWVVQFANKVGDKLPFGDSSVQITQIRLPYPSKGMVHQIYSNLVKNKYTTSAKPMALGKLWISVPRKMHLPKKSFGFIQSAMNMKMGLHMKLCDFQQTIPPSWCFGRWTNSCTIQSGTICRYSLGNFGWSKVWCW